VPCFHEGGVRIDGFYRLGLIKAGEELIIRPSKFAITAPFSVHRWQADGNGTQWTNSIWNGDGGSWSFLDYLRRAMGQHSIQ
jgi:hypothetical protein